VLIMFKKHLFLVQETRLGSRSVLMALIFTDWKYPVENELAHGMDGFHRSLSTYGTWLGEIVLLYHPSMN